MPQNARQVDIVAHLENNPNPNEVIWGPPFLVRLRGNNGVFNFNYKVLVDRIHPPETLTLVSKVSESCQWKVKSFLRRVLQRRSVGFRRGCRILEVNGSPIRNLRSKKLVLSLIQQSTFSVELLVALPRDVIPRPDARPPAIGPRPGPAPAPAPAPIQPALPQPRAESPPQQAQPHLKSYGEPRNMLSILAGIKEFNLFLPQMKWRPETIKIVLRKQDSIFGFKYTLLPQNVPKDEPTLLYCVVSDANNVQEVGLPGDTLRAWDLIVSVNNHPIHEVKAREAVRKTLETMFLKNEEITLIVQRLESIEGTLEQFKDFKAKLATYSCKYCSWKRRSSEQVQCGDVLKEGPLSRNPQQYHPPVASSCRVEQWADGECERCVIVYGQNEQCHGKGRQVFYSNPSQNCCGNGNIGRRVQPKSFTKSDQVKRVEKILRGGPQVLQDRPCSCDVDRELHTLPHQHIVMPEVQPQCHCSVRPELQPQRHCSVMSEHHSQHYCSVMPEHHSQHHCSVMPERHPQHHRSVTPPSSPRSVGEGDSHPAPAVGRLSLSSVTELKSLLRDEDRGSELSLTQAKVLPNESEAEDFLICGQPYKPNGPRSSRDRTDSLSLEMAPFPSDLSDLVQREQSYHLVSVSDHFSDNTVHNVVQNEFTSILGDPVTYPEKLNWVFLAEDEAAACTLEDAIFSEFGIPRDKPCYKVMSDGTLRNLPEDLKALCEADMAGELVLTQHLAQRLRKCSTNVQAILEYLETVSGGYTPRGMKGAVSTALLVRFLTDESLLRSQFVEVVILPHFRMHQALSSRCFYFFHVDLTPFPKNKIYVLQKLCERVNQVLCKDEGQNVFLLTDKKAGMDTVIDFAHEFREYVGETFSQRLQQNTSAGHPLFLLGERESHLINEVRTILAHPHWRSGSSYRASLVAFALSNHLHRHNYNRGVSEKQILHLVKEMKGNKDLDQRTFKEVLGVLREKGHQIVPQEPDLRLYLNQPQSLKGQSCPGRDELQGVAAAAAGGASVPAACQSLDQPLVHDTGAGNPVLPLRESAEQVQCLSQTSANATSLQCQPHSTLAPLSRLSSLVDECPETASSAAGAAAVDTDAAAGCRHLNQTSGDDIHNGAGNPVLPSRGRAEEVECRGPGNVISLDSRLDFLPCTLHKEICDSLLLGEETHTNWLQLAEILKMSAKDVQILRVKSHPANIPEILLQEWANNGGTLGQLLRKLDQPNWGRRGLVAEIYNWFQNNPDCCKIDPSLGEWFQRTLENETSL